MREAGRHARGGAIQLDSDRDQMVKADDADFGEEATP